MTTSDALAVPLPLYHCFGSVLGVLTAAVVGCRLIIPSASFDPALSLDAIVEHVAFWLNLDP